MAQRFSKLGYGGSHQSSGSYEARKNSSKALFLWVEVKPVFFLLKFLLNK
jgi:hypothetical protein